MAAHGEPCAFVLALDDKALYALELALYRQRTQVSLCVRDRLARSDSIRP
jgi:hypothetical protein